MRFCRFWHIMNMSGFCRTELIKKEGSLLQSAEMCAPLRLFSWLGSCGCSVLMLFPRFFALICRGFVHLLRSFARICCRGLRRFRSFLFQPIRLRGEVARTVQTQWRRSRGKSVGGKIAALLRCIGTVLFHDHGIAVSVFRIAVPLFCCGFLFSVVSYGMSMEYGISVRFNGAEIGVISDEADYEQAEQIVRRRLSYTENRPDFSFEREFRVTTDRSTVRLLAPELADNMLRSAAIELIDGWGVYRGKTFLGAVSDKQPIEDALTQQLSEYQISLSEDADEVFYPEELTYEKGVYLRENLTDPDDLIRSLTAVQETTRTFTAGDDDSVYSVALRFSTTAERIRELNPELTDIVPPSARVKVPVLKREYPISYRRTVSLLSFVDYDTIRTETNRISAGKEEVLQRGVKGERRNTVQITFTDGAESSRELLRSEILSLPVDEEIGVGTYTPQPFSKQTRLTGSGKFAWPLNGGYISDVFISNRNHRGLDIAAPGGTEIYAAEDGVVTVATMSGSYGNYVKLDHGDGYETLYAHCSVLLVTPEQEVTRGQVIALVGTTGHSTGNHLHFEVRLNGLNFDPADFLRVNADEEDEP